MKYLKEVPCFFLFSLIQLAVLSQSFHFPKSDANAIPKAEDECGYNSCPSLKSVSNDGKATVLNVHLIAHSHDDTGWLKTVDQYYLGSNRARFSGDQENQRVGVQYVLDSVIKELMFNPERK